MENEYNKLNSSQIEKLLLAKKFEQVQNIIEKEYSSNNNLIKAVIAIKNYKLKKAGELLQIAKSSAFWFEDSVKWNIIWLLKTKKYNEAKEQIEKHFNQRQNNFNFYYLMTRYHRAVFDFQKANHYIAELEQKFPHKIDTKIMKGKVLLEQKEIPKAISAFKEGLVLFPESVDCLLGLIRCHVTRREFNKCFEYIKRLKEVNADSIDIPFAKGLVYFNFIDYDRAMSYFLQVTEKNPFHLIAQIYVMNIFLDRRKYEKARIMVDTLFKQFPDNSKICCAKANCLRLMKQTDEALKYYTMAIDLDKFCVYAYTGKGNIFNYKEHGKALQFHERALELNPFDYRGWNNKAVVLQDMNQFEEAEEFYLKALKLEQNDPYIYSNLGNLYKSLGQFLRAEDFYRRGLELNAKISFIKSNLVDCYWKMGMRQKAVDMLSKIIEDQPKNEEYLTDLALYLSQMDRFQESLDIFDQIYKFSENKHKTLFRKSMVLLDIENYFEVRKIFMSILEENPESIEGLKIKLYYLQATNQPDEALELNLRLLDLNSENEYSWSDCVRFLADKGDLERAQSVCLKGLAKFPNSGVLFFDQAYIQKKQGFVEESILSAKQALAINPSYKGVLLFLLDIFYDRGDDPQILECLHKLKNLEANELRYFNAIRLVEDRLVLRGMRYSPAQRLCWKRLKNLHQIELKQMPRGRLKALLENFESMENRLGELPQEISEQQSIKHHLNKLHHSATAHLIDCMFKTPLKESHFFDVFKLTEVSMSQIKQNLDEYYRTRESPSSPQICRFRRCFAERIVKFYWEMKECVMLGCAHMLAQGYNPLPKLSYELFTSFRLLGYFAAENKKDLRSLQNSLVRELCEYAEEKISKNKLYEIFWKFWRVYADQFVPQMLQLLDMILGDQLLVEFVQNDKDSSKKFVYENVQLKELFYNRLQHQKCLVWGDDASFKSFLVFERIKGILLISKCFKTTHKGQLNDHIFEILKNKKKLSIVDPSYKIKKMTRIKWPIQLHSVRFEFQKTTFGSVVDWVWLHFPGIFEPLYLQVEDGATEKKEIKFVVGEILEKYSLDLYLVKGIQRTSVKVSIMLMLIYSRFVNSGLERKEIEIEVWKAKNNISTFFGNLYFEVSYDKSNIESNKGV